MNRPLAVIQKMTVTEFEKRARYQNGYDRTFDYWKIIDIHQIPDNFKESDEIDFYCCNGETVYLLRLRYGKIESFTRNETSKYLGYPPYLIAEFPIQKIDNQLIKSVLSKFEL